MITTDRIASAILDALVLLDGIDDGRGDDSADFIVVRDDGNPSDVLLHVWRGPHFRISVVREG